MGLGEGSRPLSRDGRRQRAPRIICMAQVRDGEPLGSVADGVEWALRQKIRAYRARVPGECSGGASTPRYAMASKRCVGDR